MQWFRMYNEARTDDKLDCLNDAQFRTWFRMMCLANEDTERGVIEKTTDVLLAAKVAKGDREVLRSTLDLLQDLMVIDETESEIRFLNWSKRQHKTDDVNVRVRNHREKLKEQKRNVDVTLQDTKNDECNADVTLQNEKNAECNVSPSVKDLKDLKDFKDLQNTEKDQDQKIKTYVVSDETTHVDNPKISRAADSVSEGAHQNGGNARDRPAENLDYTDDFKMFWGFYPRTTTGKKPAFRCWKTCLRKGFSATDMISAAKNYALYCDLMSYGQKQMKLATTFLGPDEHFTDFVDGVPSEAYESGQRSKGDQALQDYARKAGLMTDGSESDFYHFQDSVPGLPEGKYKL